MLSSNLSASFFIALDYFLALIIAHFDEKCTVYREFYRLLVLKAVTNYSTYSTFNFDISSGKLLTSSELLSKYDYTEADIILCIQKDINNRYDEYGSKYEEQRRIALKQNEKLADKHFEDSFVLVDNNVFYIDENNNMHNIYYAKSVAGAEGYYYDITLSK